MVRVIILSFFLFFSSCATTELNRRAMESKAICEKIFSNHKLPIKNSKRLKVEFIRCQTEMAKSLTIYNAGFGILLAIMFSAGGIFGSTFFPHRR